MESKAKEAEEGSAGDADAAASSKAAKKAEKAAAKLAKKMAKAAADEKEAEVELGELGKRNKLGTETKAARERVLKARAAQHGRFVHTKHPNKTNSDLSPRELDELVPLHPRVREILEKAGTRLNLSPRAFHRVIKVARTIADLDESPDINESHVLEALQYRERKN